MRDSMYHSNYCSRGRSGEGEFSVPSSTMTQGVKGSMCTRMWIFLFAIYVGLFSPSNASSRSAEEQHGFWLSPNLRLVKPDFVDRQIFTGLTDDQRDTLLSIRLIEGTTTYLMTYYGSYGNENIWSTDPPTRESEGGSIGCSTFSARMSVGPIRSSRRALTSATLPRGESLSTPLARKTGHTDLHCPHRTQGINSRERASGVMSDDLSSTIAGC